MDPSEHTQGYKLWLLQNISLYIDKPLWVFAGCQPSYQVYIRFIAHIHKHTKTQTYTNTHIHIQTKVMVRTREAFTRVNISIEFVVLSWRCESFGHAFSVGTYAVPYQSIVRGCYIMKYKKEICIKNEHFGEKIDQSDPGERSRQLLIEIGKWLKKKGLWMREIVQVHNLKFQIFAYL